MPTPWSMADASFPNFTEDDSSRERTDKLLEYVYLLTQELKYQLSNLGKRNFNSAALENLKTDTTESVVKEVEMLGESVMRLRDSLDEVTAVLVPDGSGGAVIGNDGQELHLKGKVYINGILLEQEG